MSAFGQWKPNVFGSNVEAQVSPQKYHRRIVDVQGKWEFSVDVYSVLKAFDVTCPALQHAIKKLLCAGNRGSKDKATDLAEAIEAIQRAIVLNSEK